MNLAVNIFVAVVKYFWLNVLECSCYLVNFFYIHILDKETSKLISDLQRMLNEKEDELCKVKQEIQMNVSMNNSVTDQNAIH